MQIKKILLLRIHPDIFDTISYPFNIDPPFNLKYIQSLIRIHFNKAAVLKDGFIEKETKSSIINHIKKETYDLIIISSSITNISESNKIAESIKNFKESLVIGIGPGQIKNHAQRAICNLPYDIIILGESEYEIINIISSVNHKDNLKTIISTYKNKFENKSFYLHEDLDLLPFPKYTKKEMSAYRLPYPVPVNKKVKWGIIIGSRGCNNSCLFCSEMVRTSFSRRLRLRSPKKIVDEMEFVMKSGANTISFEDDSITANKDFIIALTNEITRRNLNISWIARARVDEINSQIIKNLKNAGCIHLGLGIESGNQRIINLLQKQKNNSTQWHIHCKNAVKLCKMTGISTTAFFIIGNPTETIHEIKETIKFSLELNTDIIQVHFFTPYMDSNGYKLLNKNEDKNKLNLHHYATPTNNLSDVSDKQLIALRSNFYYQYIFRIKFIMSHIKKYLLFYIYNPENLLKNLSIIKAIFKQQNN